MAAKSSATPSGSEPDMPKKFTVARVWFCRMNTSNTTSTSAPTMAVIHAALTRVRLTVGAVGAVGFVGFVGFDSLSIGVGAAGTVSDGSGTPGGPGMSGVAR